MSLPNVSLADIQSHNYADATSNGNFIYGYFDSDAVGGWKGIMYLGENTDGTLTFSYWDNNFKGSLIYHERFSFLFKTVGADTYLDSSAPYNNVAISVGCSCSTTGPNAYGLSSQAQQMQYFGKANGQNVPVLTNAEHDGFYNSKNLYSFRYRLKPVGGKGTQIQLLNISHYENGTNDAELFNDKLGSGFNTLTLLGKPAAIVINPTLISVNPSSSDRLQQVTISCSNLTSDYSFYFYTVFFPATINSISSSQAQVVVPSALPIGPTTIFASNGKYQTNYLPFTIQGEVLYSGYSNQVGLTFPAPVISEPPPTVIALTVNPQNQMLTQSDTVTYNCAATMSNGTILDFTNKVTWSVLNINGSGSIGASSGIFVAINTGNNVSVNATYYGPNNNTITGVATVTIAAKYIPAAPLVSLNVFPVNTSVVIGSNEQFYYQGINNLGNIIYPPVYWSIQNGDATGSVDQNGLFTAVDLPHYLSARWWAGVAGNYLPPGNRGEIQRTPDFITKSSDPYPINNYFYVRYTGFIIPPVSGTYKFAVESGDGSNLFINKVGLVFELGTIQSVTGTVFTGTSPNLTAGVRYPIEVEWGFSTGSNGGLKVLWQPPGQTTMVAIPTSAIEGEVTNGLPVTITAQAEDGSGISGSVAVNITVPAPPALPSPNLVAIVISPKTAVVNAGSVLQFSVVSVDQYGNTAPYQNIIWSIVNSIGSGTLDPLTGIFSAEIAGSGVTITATSTDNNLISDSASVIVLPGAIAKLTVTPSNTQLQVGQGTQFTATGYDSYGNAIIPGSSLAWTVVGGNGTVNTTGLFTAVTAGTGKLLASYLGQQGQAGTNVLAYVGGVSIKTSPQQPFARIHVRDAVNKPLVVDTRTRGGGLKTQYSYDTTDNFWWDISTYDGVPFHLYGCYVGNAIGGIGNGTQQLSNNAYSQLLVENVFAKYGAPQYLGLVTPGTLVPIQQP